ncbi:hypothetical protein SK128_026528 [Halocaridina rubra]|uniref:Uncharacterized protein n=1 Tax=Halocaridina rubra TaxID=373956 RepID=A0AAN9ABU2_HALRR
MSAVKLSVAVEYVHVIITPFTDCPDSTPSLEDVVALPDPAGSSAWVYHPEEDKHPTALYPMGMNLLADFPDGSRRLPARHASFVTPRYAHVHQRPQRAQSFAVRRDFYIPDARLRPPPPVACPEPPGSKLSSQYARPHPRRVHRSNSVSGRLFLEDISSERATLSRKFHACSLDDLDGAPVIEIGTLSKENSRSEDSLSSTIHEISASDDAASSANQTTSGQERLLDGKKVLTSFSPVNHPIPRSIKPKGPAPPPPSKPKPAIALPPIAHKVTKLNTSEDKKPSNDSSLAPAVLPENAQSTSATEKSDLSNSSQSADGVPKESRLGSIPKRVSSVERPLHLPVIEENIKNIHKRPAPQPRKTLANLTDSSDPTKNASQINEVKKPKLTKPEIIKPPRPSVADKTLRLTDKTTTISRPTPVKKPEHNLTEDSKAANLKKLEEVLTNILDHGAPSPLRATKSDENIMESLKALDTKLPKSILKKGSGKPSKYEVAHREAIEDSRALLEQLPLGELQRNKIVLRVPSFRTAGCQTETYRPVRRRASCAQTNLSVSPRFRESATDNSSTKASLRAPIVERWTKAGRRDDLQEASATETSSSSSSSSSGYSSPEVSSKEPSPAQSGPPSPASSSATVSDEEERRKDTNVTVIEINKTDSVSPRLPPWHGLDPQPPPRPPKPLRLRHMSDAGTLLGRQGGLLVPVHRRGSQLPVYEDVFGLAALTENVMLLTEAINPVLVQGLRKSSQVSSNDQFTSTAPRVVDVIRKISHHPISEKSWNGRTTLIPHSKPALRTNSLTLPRPSVLPTPQPRQDKSSYSNDASSQSSDADPKSSTAAYLASLELLASHYRHQALANAKQLQLQQRLLIQQQQQQRHQLPDTSAEEREDSSSSSAPPKEYQARTSVPQISSGSSSVSPIKEESEC